MMYAAPKIKHNVIVNANDALRYLKAPVFFLESLSLSLSLSLSYVCER